MLKGFICKKPSSRKALSMHLKVGIFECFLMATYAQIENGSFSNYTTN